MPSGDVEWTWMFRRMGRSGSNSPLKASNGIRNRNVRLPSLTGLFFGLAFGPRTQPSWAMITPSLTGPKTEHGMDGKSSRPLLGLF